MRSTSMSRWRTTAWIRSSRSASPTNCVASSTMSAARYCSNIAPSPPSQIISSPRNRRPRMACCRLRRTPSARRRRRARPLPLRLPRLCPACRAFERIRCPRDPLPTVARIAPTRLSMRALMHVRMRVLMIGPSPSSASPGAIRRLPISMRSGSASSAGRTASPRSRSSAGRWMVFTSPTRPRPLPKARVTANGAVSSTVSPTSIRCSSASRRARRWRSIRTSVCSCRKPGARSKRPAIPAPHWRASTDGASGSSRGFRSRGSSVARARRTPAAIRSIRKRPSAPLPTGCRTCSTCKGRACPSTRCAPLR